MDPGQAINPASKPGEGADEFKKLSRAHGRSALRLEEIERKLDALGGHVATLVARPLAPPAPAAPPPDDLGPIFDAMDLLDQATAAVPEGAAALAEGLRGVLVRLNRFIVARGFERLDRLGRPPDGALVRVVAPSGVKNKKRSGTKSSRPCWTPASSR